MEHHPTEQKKEIMQELECAKGCKCCRDKFQGIYRTRRFTNEYFTCVDNRPLTCPHSLHFGYTCFCLCPVFIQVAAMLFKEKQPIDTSSFFLENTLVNS